VDRIRTPFKLGHQ